MPDELKRRLAALEVDTRLLGMVGALLVVWIGFDLLTEGRFLTSRNLFNLSVQTASVAVMALRSPHAHGPREVAGRAAIRHQSCDAAALTVPGPRVPSRQPGRAER